MFSSRRSLWLGLTLGVLAAASLHAADAPAPPVQQFPIPPQGFDQVRAGIEAGKVEAVQYDATAIAPDMKRPAQIYTPPGYTKKKKYPVLYLIHGAGQNDTTWIQQGNANVILDNLIADKKIVPMIVVFPNGSVGGAGGPSGGPRGGPRGAGGPPGAAAPSAGAPPAAPAGTATPAGGRGAAGSGPAAPSSFEIDLLKDLIPYVESHYSTRADRKHRALAGLSLGGMQTKAIAPANSDKFAYFGVFSGGNISPTVDVTDIRAFKKNVKLVYMSFGSKEPSNARGGGLPSGPVGIQREAEAFNKAGIKSIYYVSPDSAHDFTTWKRSLYYFSQELFRDLAR
jgi:enterochelin esterase-like enzyme